jgi:Icc-related predicted phosphoesterase
MKLFFATDVHSSESCWRKFLRAAEFYGADVLVLGGDMTGKAIVPITRLGGDRYATRLQGQRHDATGDELGELKRRIRDRGLYPIVLDPDEVVALQDDPVATERTMRRLVLETVAEWVELADERLSKLGMRCHVCPGNDDPLEVDDILRDGKAIELCEGRAVELGDGYTMLSTGWANPTPWDTHREESEEELAARIGRMLDLVDGPTDKLVFNFHPPPRDTLLDEAPALNADLSVTSGGRVSEHVGSKAVREAIDRVQPALSVHGHIHEARAAERLGRTLSVNPGSSYELGSLQGVLVELNGKRKVSAYRLTTG